MNRRIRSIFWLMTACIVGINAFQGYWLWTTYQLNRQQFVRTVQEALFQVLEREQVASAKQLMSKRLPDRSTGTHVSAGSETQIIVRRFNGPDGNSDGHGETRVFVHRRPDSLHATKSPERLVVTYNRVGPATKSVSVHADTLARRISNLVLLDWAASADVDLRKLTLAYESELRRRAIDANFRLDTLTIRPQQTQSQGNVFIFRGVSVTQVEKNDSVLRTTPEPLNPVKNLFVQASFSTPTFYLLGRMGWLLVSSVLLLALTTGCFLFMLATILRQKKLSEVKNDFINNMTHELKTPIATVTAAIEALQNFGALNDPRKTQTYLAISQNNLQRLSDLVEKVLNLATEEKRDFVLQPEPVKLADLATDLVVNHQLRAPKPIQITLAIPPETTVSVDRVHFSNALNNLIDNAINYSYDQVDIRLTYQQQASGWQLTVADTGIGIPKAYQAAIFDRFFRVPTGDLHPVKGFGLGLAYVQQVIERHGGRIRVQSEPGKGSEFILEF